MLPLPTELMKEFSFLTLPSEPEPVCSKQIQCVTHDTSSNSIVVAMFLFNYSRWHIALKQLYVYLIVLGLVVVVLVVVAVVVVQVVVVVVVVLVLVQISIIIVKI